MSRKGTSVVTAVLFIGIILSCTIFFGVSYVLDSDFEGHLFDAEKFDSDFFNNEDVRSIVTFCDYTFFKRVNNKNVIVGYDNFLFEIERNGYNFIEDHMGKLRFTENELDMIAKNLSLRQKVYSDMGIEYVIAVIPNSQTVYSEKIPFFFKKESEDSRFECMKEYLDLNTDVDILDVSAILNRIKDSYPVYNNTENTVNPLGAYFIYKEIFRALPSNYTENSILLENYIDKISLHWTDGRELAVLSDVGSIVKNRTLSISSEIPFMYDTYKEYENTETTKIKHEYRDEFAASPSVMIEYANEWDKLQLTPYFSNTFSTVVYKNNFNFNSRVIKNNGISAVIQIVRESELESFLDSNVTLSYNAGVNETVSDDVTASPLMLAKLNVDSKTLCIAGRAEEGSVLTIQGAGMKNKTMSLYGEQFILGITLRDGIEENINILAASGGKEASEPLTVAVTNDPNAPSKEIVIGENSRLFSRTLIERYVSDEKYSPVELSNMVSKHEKEQKDIQARNEKNTKFIYLAVPSKINIYSSDIDGYEKKGVSKLAQFADAFNNIKNIDVIDLTDFMIDNKHLGPLCYQTAPEWTELGAYLGYLKLAERIKRDYPAVEPHMIEDYDIRRIYVDGGEYAVKLGLDPVAFSELVPDFVPRFAPVSKLVAYEKDGFRTYQSHIGNTGLPSAVIICDSYGEGIVRFVAEHFEKLRVLNVFQKEISDNILSEISPDYIIKIFGEDNLDYFAK